MMRNVSLATLLLFFAVNCSPAPTATVDLTKARSGFLLTNGQTVSSATADDYNPQLMAKDDGTLILVFASNRTCSPCTANNYHIFVATSATPYDLYDMPLFNTPVVMNNAGGEITLGTSRANFNAFWSKNQINLILNHTGTIKTLGISAANLGTANTAGAPTTILNGTARNTDTLLMVNSKDFTMLSVSAGVVRKSLVASSDAGTVVSNSMLATAGSAVLAHYGYTGYTDALFYPSAGGLASGQFTSHFGDHFFFNEALDIEGLSLSYVSTLRTPSPALDVMVFSAQTGGNATSDLYVVSSHTAATLFLLDRADYLPEYVPLYDGGNMNYPPYRIFLYSTPVTGGFGGIPAADGMCNTDNATLPDQNAYYAALLADGVFRSSPLDFNVDWPIEPLTSYIRADTGAAIKTSDASGLLQFPWTTAVGTGSVWTGLTASWTDSANTCDPGPGAWLDSTVGSSGDYGSAASTSSSALATTPQTCNNPATIYCVEQPY